MRNLAQRMRPLLIHSTLLYTSALVILVLLWHSPVASFGWLAIVNIFAFCLFLPLIVLVPLTLYIRSWPFRVAVLLAGVLFLGLFAPCLAPRPKLTQATTRETISVATFNVFFRNQQSEDLVSAIQDSAADVVALQELSPQAATAIQQYLNQTYPYQLLVPKNDPEGLGIISRYPFEASSDAQTTRWQHVVLNVNGQPIDLLNIHFTPGYMAMHTFPIIGRVMYNYSTDQRDQQMTDALQVIDAIPGPVIVLGDFNISDREQAYAQFDQRLHDAYREMTWGFGLTYPNKKSIGPLVVPPMVRIDYVWSGGGIVPLAARSDCTSVGSDHCMLLADLSLDQGTVPVGLHTRP